MECHVPLLPLLMGVMLVLAVIPAVFIYIVVFLSMEASLQITMTTSSSSIVNISRSVQDHVMSRALNSLNSPLEDAKSQVTAIYILFNKSGLATCNAAPPDTTAAVLSDTFGATLFSVMKSRPYFSHMRVQAVEGIEQSTAMGLRTLQASVQAMYVDILRNLSGQRTLYGSTVERIPNTSTEIVDAYYPDQLTGFRLVTTNHLVRPAIFFPIRPDTGWATDVIISPLALQPELVYFTKSILALNRTYLNFQVGLNIYTISEKLRESLPDQLNDRIFVFFRQPHGHLLGASHGKFYSHSDIDMRTFDVLNHPLNISEMYFYTCLQSSDSIVVGVCRIIYEAAGNDWTAISAGNQEISINGTRYWVVVGHCTSGFECTAVAVKPRAAVMAPVENTMETATKEVNRHRVWVYTVLGFTSAMAIASPILIIWLLRRRLQRAGGSLKEMDTTFGWMGML